MVHYVIGLTPPPPPQKTIHAYHKQSPWILEQLRWPYSVRCGYKAKNFQEATVACYILVVECVLFILHTCQVRSNSSTSLCPSMC